MAKHSWVNSSMMLSMRNLRPSWVRSSTKSYDQTWLGRSARSRMHDPSFSHRRPRLGCLAGTFSPVKLRRLLHPELGIETNGENDMLCLHQILAVIEREA